MEQKHNPSEPLQDPTLAGEALSEFFKMSDEAIAEAIKQRQDQARGKLIEHHTRSLHDALDVRAKGEDEDGDESIETHRAELWKLDAEDKGLHSDE